MATNDMRVLLVDRDKECLFSTAKMLETCSYKVTAVEHISTALFMLSEGKEQFDLLVADVHSVEFDCFKLLRRALKMELPAFLMSVNEDVMLAKRYLEKGALLFLRKPVSVEIMKYLWQHVTRHKMRKIKMPDKDRLEDSRSETNNKKNNNASKSKGKRKERDKGQEGELQNNHKRKAKRKPCTEWTPELHGKFMDAIRQLGEGRCYPKEILQLMNVPSLTRMQVASHLQKCRNDDWRSPNRCKSHPNSATTSSSSSNDDSQPKINPRKFGCMPCIDKSSTGDHIHLSKSQDNQIDHEISFYLGNNNLGTGSRNGEDQFHQSQLPVVPQEVTTDFQTHVSAVQNKIQPDSTEKGYEITSNGEAQKENETTKMDSSHVFSSNHKQSLDDFFDYYLTSEMDCNIQNFAELQDGLVINQSSTSQQGLFEFDQGVADQ